MKGIPRFPGYWASRDGRIWSSYYGKWLVQTFNRKGYLQVTLCVNGRHYSMPIHRLILETYVGFRPISFVGCHNDGNKTNNHLSNLRWDTPKSNVLDAIRHGTYRCMLGCRWRAKLTWKIVAKIRKNYQKGENTHQQFADFYNVTKCTITSLLNNRTWKIQFLKGKT